MNVHVLARVDTERDDPMGVYECAGEAVEAARAYYNRSYDGPTAIRMKGVEWAELSVKAARYFATTPHGAFQLYCGHEQFTLTGSVMFPKGHKCE